MSISMTTSVLSLRFRYPEGTSSKPPIEAVSPLENSSKLLTMTLPDTSYYTELEGLMQSGIFGSSIEKEEEKNILQAFLKTRF